MRIAIVARPKPDKAGTLPLYVRAAHGGKDRYVALGLRIPASDWNPKRGEVRRTHSDHRRLNEDLAERLRRAQRAAEAVQAARGRHVTADEIKAAIEAALHPEPEAESSPAPGVVAYGRRICDEKRSAGKVGTALVYQTAMNNLEATFEELLGVTDVAVDELTADLVRAHERRLSTPKPNGLGHKVNYVNRQLRTLRTVLRRAASDGPEEAWGAGAARISAAVSEMRFKTERVEKARLGIDDIRKLEKARPGISGRRRDVLDWWLFAFYAGGMRFGDVLALRWDQIERGEDDVPVYVRWRMRKTGDAQGVPLLRQPAEILAEWERRTGPESTAPSPFVFGMVDAGMVADPEVLFSATHRWSAISRKYLRLIAKETGTTYVGFHGSRHSLADHLRKSGVPVPTISHVLGHSSIAITERYLAGFDRAGVEDALRNALG